LCTFFLSAVLLACFTSRSLPQSGSAEANNLESLARTRAIIAGSTSKRPQVLRILFYGQSITSPRWTDLAVEHLRKTYPNTLFDVRNMAIGGFSSVLLERAVERDIAEFYPDLIVFHVYGDHRAYERIVRDIRSQTAAELILQTDHVTIPVEPICREGLHLTLNAPPGCKGFLWYKQNSWEEFMSSTFIPKLARTYHAAVEPRRMLWSAHLTHYKLEPWALLADPIHPNDEGWQLMATLFEDYFDRMMNGHGNEQSDLVVGLSPPKASGAISYRFEGNRVEIVAAAALDGKVFATIDGYAAKDIEGCWIASRTTQLPNVPDWPAIRRVTVTPDVRHDERWTIRLTDFNDDQSDFRFQLFSNGRLDGDGRGRENFKSLSGDIRIEASDWAIHDGYLLSHKKMPEGFTVAWSRQFICDDQSSISLGMEDKIEVRHVLAAGLKNGTHQMTIDLTPEAVSLIREVRVYRPPLQD
jgi:hypothetical protein